MDLVALRGKLLLALALVWGGCWSASPANVTLLFNPVGPVTGGQTSHVALHVLNSGSEPQRFAFPRQIDGALAWSNQTAAVRLELNGTSTDALIAPGNFARAIYVLIIPAHAAGRVVLDATGMTATPLVLNVQPAPAIASKPSPERVWWRRVFEEAEPMEPGQPFDGARFFREHVSAYEPMYFIAGTETPNAKFQISFKYRLLNRNGPLAQAAPPLTGFHFAYSQTSLWDWNAASAPFFDSSYRPEILYVAENLTRGSSTNWLRVHAQLGLQHESNGRAGADSRSLNIAYLRPHLVVGEREGLQFILQPRVWTYVGELSDNPDIADYRGYADLRAIVGWERGPQLAATGRLGKDGDYESFQFDFTYPLMGFFPRSFSLYLHVQYFTGYGESLLRYNERESALRAGFSLTR